MKNRRSASQKVISPFCSNNLLPIGPVEKRIYALRNSHPLVIPQLDPEKFSEKALNRVFHQLKEMDVQHIAIGGSVVDTGLVQRTMETAVKDFDFSVVTYISNSATAMLKNVRRKCGVYWASVLNAQNPFFLKDALIMSSIAVLRNGMEPLPTAYVFDDRGSLGAANWISRAFPIPRDKPSLSVSVALAAQFSGSRFYIMAGGSGSKLPPPIDHVRAIRENTNLFLIPTSGIHNTSQADKLFKAGADAIHVGTLLERRGGLKELGKMMKKAKCYAGREVI